MREFKVPIREFYKDYRPPRYFFSTIANLLGEVPEEYLQGLGCIVLTNQSGKSRQHRIGKLNSRKRRIKQWGCLGLYHHRSRNGEPAWIELFVDHIAGQIREAGMGLFPMVRYSMIGKVLYHEIGHHIHRTKRPEYREPEDVADEWSKIVLRRSVRKRYWYIRPVGKPIAKVLDWIIRLYSGPKRQN